MKNLCSENKQNDMRSSAVDLHIHCESDDRINVTLTGILTLCVISCICCLHSNYRKHLLDSGAGLETHGQ